jgi:hypothetical protein
VAIGDLNGDGKSDLMTANNGSSGSGFTVSVLLGNGDGTFGVRTNFSTGVTPLSLAIGDLNSDGNLDLVTANSLPSTLSVLPGNGDGTFGSKRDYGTGIAPISLAIGDLNGDGTLDLSTAYGTYENSTVSALLGNGDGSFGVKADFGTGVYPTSVAVGDLNGDGKLDLATANNGSTNLGISTVSVLLGRGDGTFGLKTDFGTGDYPKSVAIGDLNGDGKPDLAVACPGSSAISVLLGNGDGTFGVRTDFGAGTFPQFVAIGDLNGDGKPDLAAVNDGSSTVSVLLGNGDGSFGVKTDFAVGGGPQSVAIRDLNADGKADLAVANSTTFSVSVLLGNGDGSFGGKTDYELGNLSYPYSVAIGDLNGDSKPDLVVAKSLANTLSVLLGNGDGTFGGRTDFGAGGFPVAVAIGDLNGDGKLDLGAASPGSNSVSILLQLGSQSPGLTVTVDLDPNTISLKSHAPWVTAYIEPSEFDPVAIDFSSLRLAESVPAEPKTALLGDHDRDGLPDLAVKFSRPALNPLLTVGVNSLEVTGSLVTGESFEGSGEVRVIDPGQRHQVASVVPNPLNPSGTLLFHTVKPGRVTVTIYDPHGRLVRTLMEVVDSPAGEYAVRIDGRGGRSERLSSGVYFYRINTPDGAVTGRFTIMK